MGTRGKGESQVGTGRAKGGLGGVGDEYNVGWCIRWGRGIKWERGIKWARGITEERLRG